MVTIASLPSGSSTIMNFKYILAPIALFAMSAMSQAADFTWNFAEAAGPVNAAHKAFTSTTVNGVDYVLTAYGFHAPSNAPALPTNTTNWNFNNATSVNLYEKYDGANSGETGLGLSGEGDHEIERNTFIQLDLVNLQHHLKDLTIFVGSLQQGEGFDIWGSNTLGTPGQFLYSSHSVHGSNSELIESYMMADINTYRYVSVSAWTSPNGQYASGSDDVCIKNGLSAVPAPEPAPMLALGLGAVVMLRRRKK